MKTEHNQIGDVHLNPNGGSIWSGNVELLSPEVCLPIMGSCQVSSILQNLDQTHTEQPTMQNMDLIILHNNQDYKLPLNLHTNNYIVLKEPPHSELCLSSPGIQKPVVEDTKTLQPTDLSLNMVETNSNSSVTSNKHYDKESFEDMLYFVCNLCPFLCTKEVKITEHLESAHKNKTVTKLVQLKCPACANIFYHRASLKSHLLHDHCVASGDLSLIVQVSVNDIFKLQL